MVAWTRESTSAAFLSRRDSSRIVAYAAGSCRHPQCSTWPTSVHFPSKRGPSSADRSLAIHWAVRSSEENVGGGCLVPEASLPMKDMTSSSMGLGMEDIDGEPTVQGDVLRGGVREASLPSMDLPSRPSGVTGVGGPSRAMHGSLVCESVRGRRGCGLFFN